jgi:hypothetical protein
MQAKPTTIFISHASEDKHDFVRPLAHALKSRGLRVWYDEFSLKLGDSLRRSIDKGLAECSAGVAKLETRLRCSQCGKRGGAVQVFKLPR